MPSATNNAPSIEVQPLLPLLIIATGGAMAGFSGIMVRLSETGACATAAWRLLIAVIVFLPLLRLKSNRAPGSMRLSPIVVIAGLFFAVDMGFYNIAIGLTAVAHATLIVNMAPIVALAAGYLLFSERFGKAKMLGLVAALTGAALMTLTRSDGGGTLIGNGSAAIAMVGYALYLVAVKHARQAHNTLSIMVWSSIVASGALFVAAFVLGEKVMPDGAEGWIVLIALGLIAHVAGQGLVAFGMQRVPVGLASIMLLSQPVVATISAWIIFDEQMSLIEAGGAALVLAGLVIASRSRG